MGVVMTKPHPLPHLHMLNNAQTVPWKSHVKFQPGWSFDKFLRVKQLPVSVAMAKPHPIWLIMLAWVLGRAHIKFWPDMSINWLLVAKTTSCGCS